jgi:hypothetical protein
MSAHRTTDRPLRRRGAVWVAGLVVALGAGVATAHGLYGVATAARVPAGIAWLYPLITDGLALVAYATTARLSDAGRRYAWTVVVLAAGLSGLAQAAYLAGGIHPTADEQVTGLATALRFGVGAWPALAAAIVAHLLHLLDTAAQPVPQPVPVPAVPVQLDSTGGTPASGTGTDPEPSPARDAADAGSSADPDPAGDESPPANRPKHTDADVLAALAGRTGPIAVRAAAREFDCGADRARRLLAEAGLLATSGSSSGHPTPDPDDGNTLIDRRALHIVHGSPDQPRTTP